MSHFSRAPVAVAQPESWWLLAVVLASEIVRRREREASPLVVEATALLPIAGAGLALHPGTPTTVAERFGAQQHCTLVLFAIGGSAAGTAAPGPR